MRQIVKTSLTVILAVSVSALCYAGSKQITPESAKKSSLSKKYTDKEAVEILKEAERIRSLAKARVMVDLKTLVVDAETNYKMEILRSTEKRAYIDFLSPQEERGRRMLAQGNNYWSTFPDSKRVVAISRKEMIGNSAFAMADIFQLDAEKDYNPKIVAEEMSGKQKLLKLDLKAKHDDAPYDRIHYWVEEKGSFPVKAKFFSFSGKLLKTMTVETRKKIAGRLRPEIAKMVDEVIKGRVSWWKTLSMKKANIPEHVFSKDYLKSQ